MPPSNPTIVYQVTAEDLQELIDKAVAKALAGYLVAPKPEPEDKYLTSDQVVERLQISPTTLYNWKITGKLKSYRISNRVLYKSSEIEEAVQLQVPLKYRRMKR